MSNYLICDLEATCWDDRPQTIEQMEIIEIGCVVCSPEGRPISEFSTLCKPVREPLLSTFCTNLTGITQDMVDTAPEYYQALNDLDAWTKDYPIAAWGSWGEYDRRQFRAMAEHTGVTPEFTQQPHFNVRKVYQTWRGANRKADVHHALQNFGMKWEGPQHRALDDVRNISRLIPHLLRHVEEKVR